jgi:hypothetical protein
MKLLLVSKLDRMARGVSTIANYVRVGGALGRLATLRHCDAVLKIEDGRVRRASPQAIDVRPDVAQG